MPMAKAVQVPAAITTVAQAPWRGLITTTFDALWASALADDAEVVSRTAFAANASSLADGHGRFLLQIFGRADVPASLCLAPAEIPAKIGATGAASFVAGLYHKWSFVFVGYQPDDPDLNMLVQRVLGASETRVPHFLLAPQLSNSDARPCAHRAGPGSGFSGVYPGGDARHAGRDLCPARPQTR